jgi:hypothetical protein
MTSVMTMDDVCIVFFECTTKESTLLVPQVVLLDEFYFGQFQIGICLVDFEVKMDGKVSFWICVFLKGFFFNTMVTNRFFILFVPICISFLFY